MTWHQRNRVRLKRQIMNRWLPLLFYARWSAKHFLAFRPLFDIIFSFAENCVLIPDMASSQSIEDIIRQECLPLRDCMLTVTDANGEAAFLYFKEGELIEANYAALWGKEALAQIISWKLADSTVAPLPLGIKRSLWDQIEFLLNPGLV